MARQVTFSDSTDQRTLTESASTVTDDTPRHRQTCSTVLQEHPHAVRHRPDVGYFSSIGDFNHLGGRAKIPTVIVGPNGANVHRTDEYVQLDEVVETAQVVADTISRLVEWATEATRAFG